MEQPKDEPRSRDVSTSSGSGDSPSGASAGLDSASDVDGLVPGKYALLRKAGVLATANKGKILRVLEKGADVDITEVQRVEKENTIRGRLADGGWISIKNTGT